MASIFFKRLEKKFGKKNLSGDRYQDMISEILAHNNEKIANAVGRLSNDSYKASAEKLNKKKQKAVTLPDMAEVIPKRSVFLIKGAEQGSIISDTLRTKLEGDLRKTIADFQKRGKIETKRGTGVGKINTDLIDSFRGSIIKTFESYTKKDKTTGVPPNIKTIATTEIRSTINSIKAEYNKNLLAKNPGMVMMKTWKHNRSLSKVPRKEHMEMDGETVPANKFFLVYNKAGQLDMMDRPHDPEAPAGQSIGCNCDVIYTAQLPDTKSPKE